MLTFTIPGPPRGKGRPRFSRKSGSTYTDAQTASYENLVALAAREAMAGAPPITGPVSLAVVGYFLIPASLSAKKRTALQGAWHSKKPDADNLLKAVLDGCNGVLFVDDAQVCRLHVSKVYDERPRVEIVVVEAEQ